MTCHKTPKTILSFLLFFGFVIQIIFSRYIVSSGSKTIKYFINIINVKFLLIGIIFINN